MNNANVFSVRLVASGLLLFYRPLNVGDGGCVYVVCVGLSRVRTRLGIRPGVFGS